MIPCSAQPPILKSDKKTAWAMAALCLCYLIFQLIYIPYTAFSVDEFWFAHHIYEYTHKIPYRDFLPYKTVLGYYVLSLPFYFSHTILHPLYYLKDEIALLNTLALAITCIGLSRFFHPRAVLYTLILVLANQSFLFYSVDLRVDMLTTWLGLFSVLLLLSNRYSIAGLLLALSFLVSQKALWFFVASNVALSCYWLTARRDWPTLRNIIVFNLATSIPIALYILGWSILSNHALVLNSVFLEGYTQAKINWYAKIYVICWQAILYNGPILIFLWPLTWLGFMFLQAKDAAYQRRIFIACYAITLMIFIISYQQPFPYNMVYCTPIYFLIFADFFSWLRLFFRKKSTTFLSFNSRKLFWFIALYSLSLLSLSIILRLPSGYYFILLIPSLVAYFMLLRAQKNRIADELKTLIIVLLICTGLLYPLLRFTLSAYHIKGDYQKYNLLTAHQLLEEGGGFFAGAPFFYDRNQAILGLRNLIGPALEYLSKPSNALLPIMIPSLYLVPQTEDQVLADLKNTPVKLYINNYRVASLPPKIHAYLLTEFAHYWGSIYLYAPQIRPTTHVFSLKFTGRYQITSQQKIAIQLDHQLVQTTDIVTLTEGKHTSYASQAYRLTYLPAAPSLPLKQRYQKDHWEKMIKAIVT